MDAEFALRIVGRAAEVHHRRVRCKGNETMSKTFRDEQSLAVFGVEGDAHMLTEGGGADANIDDDVEDCTAGASHVLGLAGWHGRSMDATDNAD